MGGLQSQAEKRAVDSEGPGCDRNTVSVVVSTLCFVATGRCVVIVGEWNCLFKCEAAFPTGKHTE